MLTALSGKSWSDFLTPYYSGAWSAPGSSNIIFWGRDNRPVLTIRFDTSPVTIEAAADVAADDAAKAVITALSRYLEQAIEAAAARRIKESRP
jgi:hypothetical protein